MKTMEKTINAFKKAEKKNKSSNLEKAKESLKNAKGVTLNSKRYNKSKFTFNNTQKGMSYPDTLYTTNMDDQKKLNMIKYEAMKFLDSVGNK